MKINIWHDNYFIIHYSNSHPYIYLLLLEYSYNYKYNLTDMCSF
jgi:hypothetical protein